MQKKDTWRDPAVAAEYDRRRFGGPLQRLKHRRDEALVSALLWDLGPGARVLDLPTGTGRLLTALAAGGERRVLAADISLEMLRALRAAGRQETPGLLPPVCASAFRLPFATGALDAVVSLRFLFHLDDAEERVRVLAELARVCAGPILGQVRYRATAKHLGRWARSRVGLARRYRPSGSRTELEDELGRAGLRLERLVPVSRAFSDKALFRAVRQG